MHVSKRAAKKCSLTGYIFQKKLKLIMMNSSTCLFEWRVDIKLWVSNKSFRAWLYEADWLGAGSFKGKSIYKYSSAITETCPTIKFRLYEAGWKRVGSPAELARFHETDRPTWGKLARSYNGLSRGKNGLVHVQWHKNQTKMVA